jgi:hypothetical protein
VGSALAQQSVLPCQDVTSTVNGPQQHSCVPVSTTNPLPVTGATSPATLAPVALDASSVVTGGTAVTASAAGHHNKGGWIQNPSTATINLCINEQATASGTTSSGALVCITPGQNFTMTPSSTTNVSVVSSDSSHAFAGQGYN